MSDGLRALFRTPATRADTKILSPAQRQSLPHTMLFQAEKAFGWFGDDVTSSAIYKAMRLQRALDVLPVLTGVVAGFVVGWASVKYKDAIESFFDEACD